MLQQCIDGQKPPTLKRGDLVEEGEFLRNLKKKHVSKRYEKDSDDEPEYGYKLPSKFWKDADKEGGHLSVNLKSCMHSIACSIAIHPRNDEYYHVAIIELSELSKATSPIVAQYQPVEEEKNSCHFELMPLDGTVLKWLELQTVLDSPFPLGKLPVSKDDKQIAAQQAKEFQLIFRVERWVRSPDGELSL